MITLLRSRRRMLNNSLRQLGTGKSVLMLLFILFLLGSISWIVAALFSHIAHEPAFTLEFKLFISEKILQMAFMAAFIMTVISSLVSTVNILYLSKDLPLLISSPLPLSRLMSWKTIEVAASSSFMAVLLSLPMLIGYAFYFARRPDQLLLICLATLLLFGSAVIIGMLIGLLLPAFVSIRTLQPLLSVISVILIAAAVIGLRLLRPEKLFSPESIDNLVLFMNQFQMGPASALPSAWLSGAILQVSQPDWPAALLETTKLLALLLIGWLLFHRLNRRFFLVTFEKLWQGKSRRYKRPLSEKTFVRTPAKALLMKERAMFFRSTEQWTQLLVVLAILAIFILNMQSLPFTHPYLRHVLTFFTFGMGAFIIAGLNIRFTFTALPMDFPGAVHVLCAPLDRSIIFNQKLRLHMLFHGFTGLLLFLATILILKPAPFMTLSGGLFIFSSLPLFTVGALGSGMALCSNSTLSPQHLIMSRQGIFYMIATFFHTLLMFALFTRPLYLHFRQLKVPDSAPTMEITLWLGIITLLNLLAALGLYNHSRRRWLSLDF
jgi:ABC-2 type transport system permease protein